MQSGKAQISMRDSLTFLDDGDEHVASSTETATDVQTTETRK